MRGQHALPRGVADGHLLDLPLAVLAVDGRIAVDLALLQGRGHDEGLEGGTGFQGVGGQPVAVDHGAGLPVGIGIEEGILRPGQDVAAGHIHHQGPAPAGIEVPGGTGHGFFGDELQLHVQRQHQVLAAELVLAFFMQVKTAPHGVALHHHAGGRARKTVVQRAFQAFQAFVVHAHEAEQLPGKMLEGIDAVVFLGKADAGQARLAHGLGGVIVHFAAHPDKTALGLGKLVIELLRFDAEDGPQGVGHGQEILDLLRPGIDGTGLHAAGQHLPVAVHDHAALAGDQLRGHMLAAGLVGQARALDHLQIPGTAPQAQPQDAEDGHDSGDAGLAPVHPVDPAQAPVLGRNRNTPGPTAAYCTRCGTARTTFLVSGIG